MFINIFLCCAVSVSKQLGLRPKLIGIRLLLKSMCWVSCLTSMPRNKPFDMRVWANSVTRLVKCDRYDMGTLMTRLYIIFILFHILWELNCCINKCKYFTRYVLNELLLLFQNIKRSKLAMPSNMNTRFDVRFDWLYVGPGVLYFHLGSPKYTY